MKQAGEPLCGQAVAVVVEPYTNVSQFAKLRGGIFCPFFPLASGVNRTWLDFTITLFSLQPAETRPNARTSTSALTTPIKRVPNGGHVMRTKKEKRRTFQRFQAKPGESEGGPWREASCPASRSHRTALRPPKGSLRAEHTMKRVGGKVSPERPRHRAAHTLPRATRGGQRGQSTANGMACSLTAH